MSGSRLSNIGNNGSVVPPAVYETHEGETTTFGVVILNTWLAGWLYYNMHSFKC